MVTLDTPKLRFGMPVNINYKGFPILASDYVKLKSEHL
jgi:hypothetical protein